MMTATDRKVALVTHALQFAGPGSIESLVSDGWIVLAHDLTFADSAGREEYARDHEGVEIMEEQDAEALGRAALQRHGRIDALVSNDIVAINEGEHPAITPIETVTAEKYQNFVESGMLWSFRLLQTLLPQMRKRRSGSIIFITSAAAQQPSARTTIYSAVRAATTAFALSLAKELGPDNIQVNAIGPTWFKNETYFSEKVMAANPPLGGDGLHDRANQATGAAIGNGGAYRLARKPESDADDRPVHRICSRHVAVRSMARHSHGCEHGAPKSHSLVAEIDPTI